MDSVDYGKEGIDAYERAMTNPLEGFGIISKQQWDKAQAEIERLKAELELRTRERDQAS